MARSSNDEQQRRYIKDLEGRNFAQGLALVRIADICRVYGGQMAAEILFLAGEILVPQAVPKKGDADGRGKT